MGMDRLTLEPDLPQTLAHVVVKYLLRVTPCEPTISEDHHFTLFRTGWGKRSLDDSELALALELASLRKLQIMRTVMDEIISQLTPAKEAAKRLKISHTPAASSLCSEVDRHWIPPALQKWLPGSWAAELPISDRAVKSDNAVVNLSPWHSRIQLVLPWCRTRFITLFEELG